jgi:non-specific serine/threonine protein kinase/serine/threonine-protein kinase
LPVIARPATFSYRASKFFQRNKVPVVAGVFIFLALLTGIIVALWQAQIARAERQRAEQRFNEVRELANNVIFKYHDAIAALPGSTATREMLVTDALKYLDNLSQETEGNIELQRELAAAYFKLGDVQGKQYEANIGDTAGAAESYKKAVSLLEQVTQTDKNNLEAKLELVRIYEALFAAYMRFADAETKQAVLSKAINLQDDLIAAEPQNTKFQLQKIQLLLRKADSTVGLQNTLTASLETLNIAENLLQTNGESDELNKTLARLYQRAGTLYVLLGDEAEKKKESPAEFYRQALPFHEKSLIFAEKNYFKDQNNLPNRRRYAVALINLSETSAKNGLKDEAKIQSALELLQKTADEDPRNLEAKFDVAEVNRVQAEIRQKFGETSKAIENLKTALNLYQIIWQTDKKNLESRNAIGDAHRKLAELYNLSSQNRQAEFHRQEFENIKIGN